jgi:multidrug efflux pump
MEENKSQKTDKSVKKEFGLSSLAINNRTSVVILTLIIIVMGISSYVSMPKESFPEIVIPTIYVGTAYPGNSPVDMENLVTRPIEKEIKGVTGIKKINSTSIQDYSTIIVEFNPDVEVPKALQDVKDAVDQAKSELPTDLDQDPNVFDVNFSELPIMFVNLSGDFSVDELKQFAEYLQDEIETLSEIQEANISGAMDREIRVDADIYKMEAMEVSFNDIRNAIAAENVTLSGGNILTNDYRRTLRVDGEFTDPSQIEDVIIKSENDQIVYVKDVAEVRDTYAERTSFARSSGQPVVTLDIVKRSGENLLNAADKIKELLDEAQQNRFPENLNISITNDQSRQTRLQVENLWSSIISGVILVVLVLMFFMNLRNALFVGVAIPLSMLMSFMILNALGVTLNLMVLFSLILALGMLVDNGIVVVENIYRLLQEGYTPIAAAKEGVGEVALPIITSTATTLAAFTPLAFWQGLIGEFMRYLPITLIIVLSSSLFVALVVNPVLTAMYMKLQNVITPQRRKRLLVMAAVFVGLSVIFYLTGIPALGTLAVLAAVFIPFNIFLLTPAIEWFQEVFLNKLENAYEGTVTVALRKKNPYFVFFGTILLLFLSVGLVIVSQPKVEFFPVNEPDYINIFVEKPIGTDIKATNEFTRNLEQEVVAYLEPYNQAVEAVITQVGEGTSDPNEGPSQGSSPNKARINVSFVEYQERGEVSSKEILTDLRDMMEKYPGVLITVDKNQNGPPVGKPINVEVSGENYDRLISLVQDIKSDIENSGIQGIEELKTDLQTGKPELLFNINRDKAQRFGLSTNTIASELRTALFGVEVTKYKEGEDEYPVQLRLKDKYRYDVEALLNKSITFRDKFGKLKQVPISSVADIRYSSTFGSVKRKDLDRVVSIYSNVEDGYNANEIVNEMKLLLADKNMPEGYQFKFTGEQEEQAASTDFLLKAMFIAVMSIFLIIVAQFNSVMTPFIIIFSVILSTIGVFLGLVAFSMDFVVIMTGIGIISLAGVVVNNAIVLIDYTNLVRKRRKKELGVAEDDRLPYNEVVNSIISAGKTRLRPVLLTAITTVLGLIPLALGVNINFYTLLSEFDPQFYMGGTNADFWGPMAWTVIFGLIFATFLTLVVVPVMYLLADRLNVAVKKEENIAA